MAHTSASQSLLTLARSCRRLNVTDPLTQCLAPRITRSFATQTDLPIVELARETVAQDVAAQPSATTTSSTRPGVLTTLYSWPELEPKRFALYSPKYLDLPLRKDLLHRAVVYEADAARQGSASTKWRADVHGSNRKIRQQKGTGMARLGDKKSPMLRGGGVAFGPKPRDFSTELQRKVYDIAWRTALSFRYRKGELIVLDNRILHPQDVGPRWMENVVLQNRWGREHGRSLLLTEEMRDHESDMAKDLGAEFSLKDIADVGVKDLLFTGRIVIEKSALDALLAAHSADLGRRLSLEFARSPSSQQGIVQYL